MGCLDGSNSTGVKENGGEEEIQGMETSSVKVKVKKKRKWFKRNKPDNTKSEPSPAEPSVKKFKKPKMKVSVQGTFSRVTSSIRSSLRGMKRKRTSESSVK